MNHVANTCMMRRVGMIKLPIKDLELKLGKTLKRNFVSIGIDTATTTGIGIISANDKEVEIDWSLIKFEANSQIELYKQMYYEFQNRKNKRK